MSDSAEPILLDDARMQHFIDRGYVTLRSALPRAYHDELCATLERVIAAEGNPGNNLLPRIPRIARMLADPHVIGALTSILGPGYTMHAHRYCHVNTPGRKPTRIHTDSPEDFFHRDRWALLFYYPQDTPPELGPTGVLPGSQYHAERPDEIPMRKLAGEAGTFVIVHHNIWHQSTLNECDRNRFMLKFLFRRTAEPAAPAWRRADRDWDARDPIRQAMWAWHNHGETPRLGNGDMPALAARLHDDRESERLQAAYRLALNGSGLPALADALTGEDGAARPAAATGLAAAGASAVGLLDAAVDHERSDVRRMAAAALGEIGPGAIGAAAGLEARLDDEEGEVRQRAARSLGLIGAGDSVPALEDALQDRDEHVREHAAEALGLLTRGTERAVAPLAAALHDSARYVRGAAAEALRFIGTAGSTERLLDYLAVSRWCPTTTRDSPY
ncbi:MAG: HEAT repeat domain-containing protein [Spirochaetaceae bacterium]|nr:HEAT repeat domain-containing protein [Spirochaetaceae bacterium]